MMYPVLKSWSRSRAITITVFFFSVLVAALYARSNFVTSKFHERSSLLCDIIHYQRAHHSNTTQIIERDVVAECGKTANPSGKLCPLNACCNAQGVCGSSSDFCDVKKGCQSNCGDPTIPDGKARGGITQRTIGYYEAWSTHYPCHVFPPAAIPIDGLTHLSFAFASIRPETFEITTMDPTIPASLFTETAGLRALKSGNADLQVFISIGGWGFSENGSPTQPLFGELSKTEENRQKFADNVVSFMRQYGFEGIDIDWQFPGAPDRGGHPEDTQNYVALLKTLKETFTKSVESYGLSFTIPSSYKYLRFFDVPSMLQYADWTNLMSYDLHGSWLEDNNLGEVVQAHTNLTEIQQAVNLLWRVEVPPAKVNLGFGFYGRTFQLQDTACSRIGCPAKGPGDPGDCTTSRGTLALFEIQDLIASQKPSPKIIHDQEAAVNYINYKEDQWASYDNDVTVKQKVDWANSQGLGGSMIWSVDQDDARFSGLSWVAGRDIGSFDNQIRKSSVSDAGHWASVNGQKCKVSECGVAMGCPPGFAMADHGNSFPDTCPKGESKVICCPVNAMPSTCQWRGGELTRSCHGQCHTGEATIAHSRHATVNCYKPGFQAFCCKAETWSNFAAQCKYTDCKGHCDRDTVRIARKFDLGECAHGTSDDPKGEYREFCCPKESSFDSCHWVGRGTCDDNECADTDVQLDTDAYGDNAKQCAAGMNDRRKSLCCNSPKNLNPFLPVTLDKVFPTLPPGSDLPKFDLQLLGADSPPVTNEPNQQTFGMVIIDGPSSAVTSLRRRAEEGFSLPATGSGSHWQILSCEPMQDFVESSILQMICMDDSEASNCWDIYEGGVEGTIVEMPAGCGKGTYAVAHSFLPSLSQKIPTNLHTNQNSVHTIVYDIELSYDFGLAKRDAGEVFVRVDYSNVPNYWDKVVQAKPQRKRSFDKRYFSTQDASWKAIYDDLRSADGTSDNKGESSLKMQNVDQLIIGDSGKDKQCKDDKNDAFLSLKLGGVLEEAMQFGFTFVGTISPNFHLEEASGFFDSKINHWGTLDFDGKGFIDTSQGFSGKSIFGGAITKYAFDHPGIISMSPSLDVFASLQGSGPIDGKFQVNFLGGNGIMTKYNQPQSLGKAYGASGNYRPIQPFTGTLASPETQNKQKRATTDSTLLAVMLDYEAQMHIEIKDYTSNLNTVNSTFREYVNSYIRLNTLGAGGVQVTMNNPRAGLEYTQTGDIPGWRESSGDIQVGSDGAPSLVHRGNTAPDARGAPEISGRPVYDSNNIITCSKPNAIQCLAPSELLRRIPELGNDPENNDSGFDDNSKRDKTALEDRSFVLEKRAREFDVTTPSGIQLTLRAPGYPYGGNGAVLRAIEPNAGAYDVAHPEDCDDITITSASTDPESVFRTEHIVELSYFGELLNFAMTGNSRAQDGVNYRTLIPRVPENIFHTNGAFQQNYAVWDLQAPTPRPGSPLSRVWQAFGSNSNTNHFVNAEDLLNRIKSNVWRGLQPISDDTWRTRRYARNFDRETAETVLSLLREVRMVFEYFRENQVNQNFAAIVVELREELDYFSERYNAVYGTNIALGDLHREFIDNVLIPRMERIAQSFLQRRVEELLGVWQLQGQANPPNPWAANVVVSLENIKRDLEENGLWVDRSGLPSPPFP